MKNKPKVICWRINFTLSNPRIASCTPFQLLVAKLPTYVRSAFINGGLGLKKEILMFLGYNPQIKAGKLYLEAMEWFAPIKKEALALQLTYQRLELNKKPVTKVQTAALSAIRAQWRDIVNDVRTIIQNYSGYTFIPDFQPQLTICPTT